MLTSVKPIQSDIESLLIKNEKVDIILSDYDLDTYVSKTTILESGAIIIENNADQIMILIPQLNNDQVNWQCIGKPSIQMPRGCRMPNIGQRD